MSIIQRSVNFLCRYLNKPTESRFLLNHICYVKSYLIAGPDSMDIPFVKKPVHYYSDRSQAPEWLRDAEKKLETCDGFIYLCPEVNRSIPANLSNMIDHFGSNVYQAKPAAIITYSDTG